MIKRSLMGALLFAAATLPAQAAGSERVFIEYKSGREAILIKRLEANGAKIHYRFSALGAVAATVPEGLLKQLAADADYTVSEDPKRYPMAQTVPYGIDKVQARDVWDVNRDGVVDAGAPTGAGRTVCIIDSGIAADHEDLAALNIVGGTPAGWNTDSCGHGSHVAGTIAAVNNSLGVVGVSPGAVSLYIVKVFDGADCGWSYASSLVDAANQCAAAGSNVINMSLGGGRRSLVEQAAFARLNRQGVLAIASAGNDGTTRLNYPASYSTVVSVAATDVNDVVADFSQKNAEVDIAAPGVSVLSTVPFGSEAEFTVGSTPYAVLGMEGSAYGSATGPLVYGGLCTAPGSWTNAVVLCERGSTSFGEKAAAAVAGGAKAAIVYNNEPGSFSGTLGEGVTSTIPVLSMSQADGQALVAGSVGASATASNTYITNTYAEYSGTSMAAPHVAGVAAVLWSSQPSASNEQIRAALINTAKDLGPAGRDDSYGAGLVQLYDAWQYLGAARVAAAKPPLKAARTPATR